MHTLLIKCLSLEFLRGGAGIQDLDNMGRAQGVLAAAKEVFRVVLEQLYSFR